MLKPYLVLRIQPGQYLNNMCSFVLRLVFHCLHFYNVKRRKYAQEEVLERVFFVILTLYDPLFILICRLKYSLLFR